MAGADEMLGTITDHEFTETALIVTTLNGNSGLPQAVSTRAARLGCTEPLIVIVDHPADFRVLRADELADTAVLVLNSQLWSDPDLQAAFANQLRRKCRELGLQAGPLLVTVADPATDLAPQIQDRETAARTIGHLQVRFGL